MKKRYDVPRKFKIQKIPSQKKRRMKRKKAKCFSKQYFKKLLMMTEEEHKKMKVGTNKLPQRLRAKAS